MARLCGSDDSKTHRHPRCRVSCLFRFISSLQILHTIQRETATPRSSVCAATDGSASDGAHTLFHPLRQSGYPHSRCGFLEVHRVGDMFHHLIAMREEREVWQPVAGAIARVGMIWRPQNRHLHRVGKSGCEEDCAFATHYAS